MRIHKCIVWLILCLFLLLVVPAVSWFMWQYRSWDWRSPVPVTDDRILEMLQSRPSPVPASSSASVENGREDITATQQAFKSWNRSVITLIEPKIPRNCSALMSGDAAEINRVEQSQQNWKSSSYNKKFNKLYIDSGDCQEIRTEFENNLYVSEEERSFPLAFSMTVHNDAQQIVRFLKAIYRPQNIYCIHYDKKSSSTFKKIFDNIAKCLNNVIIPKKIVNIVYECYPILEAQLSCMADLLKERKAFPWKYTTTLCGKEIPLRTNREMVHLLKQMKGLPVVYAHDFLSGEYSIKMHRMKIKKNICTRTWTAQKQPVPYGLKLLKSMAYFSLTPEFTNFILNSAEGKALYQFLKPTKGPEEAFYGTLLQYWLNGTEVKRKYPPTAGTIWLPKDDPAKRTWKKNDYCSGSVVHRICIIASGDLHRLGYSLDSNHVHYPLFHNKYSMADDHTVMDCVEELLIERNKHEFLIDKSKNRTKLSFG